MESSEAREFRSVLRSFISEHFSEEDRRSRYSGALTVNTDDLWSRIAPLGVLDALRDGSASIDWLTSIAFESGYGLLPIGLVQTCIAHCAVRNAEGTATGVHLLPDQRVSIALEVSNDLVIARDGAGSVRIRGTSPLVPFLSGSAWIFVPVATNDANRVAAIQCSDGTVTETTSIDRTVSLGRLVVKDAPAILLPHECANVVLYASLACGSAEAAGVCERVVEDTCRYVKDRKQFDVPIGGFQAIQHKLADMHLETEALKSTAFFAGWALHASPEQRELTARAASRYREMVACSVVERAIQVHGGIGFTWEHTLHHFLRRVQLLQALMPGGEDAAGRVIEAAGPDNDRSSAG